MGLAISKSIVESNGGPTWANGDGGRGAMFHFTLPAAPAETDLPVDAAAFDIQQSGCACPVGVSRCIIATLLGKPSVGLSLP